VRPAFHAFLSRIKCVEVGVHSGKHAREMLEHLPTAQFFLIDSYDVNNSTFQDSGKPPKTEAERLTFIQAVIDSLTPYGNRAHLIIKDSEEAAKYFDDESLDFVYIDAQHEYAAVMKDIRTWWPKVRKGGILSGDDCVEPSVKQAVLDCFRDKVMYGNDHPDWIVSK